MINSFFFFSPLPLKCSKLWFHRAFHIQSWLCAILQGNFRKRWFSKPPPFWYSFVIAQGQEFLKKVSKYSGVEFHFQIFLFVTVCCELVNGLTHLLLRSPVLHLWNEKCHEFHIYDIAVAEPSSIKIFGGIFSLNGVWQHRAITP